MEVSSAHKDGGRRPVPLRSPSETLVAASATRFQAGRLVPRTGGAWPGSCRGAIGERSAAIVRAGVLEDPQGRTCGPRASCGAAPRRRRSLRSCRRDAASPSRVGSGSGRASLSRDARTAGSTCGTPLLVASAAVSGNGSSRPQQRRAAGAARAAAWRAGAPGLARGEAQSGASSGYTRP